MHNAQIPLNLVLGGCMHGCYITSHVLTTMSNGAAWGHWLPLPTHAYIHTDQPNMFIWWSSQRMKIGMSYSDRPSVDDGQHQRLAYSHTCSLHCERVCECAACAYPFFVSTYIFFPLCYSIKSMLALVRLWIGRIYCASELARSRPRVTV